MLSDITPIVPQGLVRTPFDERIAGLMITDSWSGWAGYRAANVIDTLENEYFAVRNQTTLFDLCPMHKYRITGPDAEAVMNRLITRDVRKIRDNRVGYSIWCDEDGSVIDDGTLFRFGPQDFRLCSQEPQYSWLHDIAWGYDVTIEDESHTIAGVSLQGPTSYAVLKAAGLESAGQVKRFGLYHPEPDLMISRTGFTGDLGYELWTPWDKALAMWDRIWAAGQDYGIRPIGGEALDMVRLEAGFFATDLDFMSIQNASRSDRGRTPFELDMAWLVDFDKGFFNGRRALLQHAKNGPRYKLVKLDIETNKPAHGALVYHGKRSDAGQLMTAYWSPVCKRNIGLAMLKAPYGVDILDDLWVEIYHDKELQWRRYMAKATIVEGAFFKNPRASATPPGLF